MMETNITQTYPKPFSEQIKYDRQRVIKKEAFGQIYLGFYGNENVSVKRIVAQRVKVMQRIELQIDLNHDNVIKLYTVENDENFWYGAAFSTFLKRNRSRVQKVKKKVIISFLLLK